MLFTGAVHIIKIDVAVSNMTSLILFVAVIIGYLDQTEQSAIVTLQRYGSKVELLLSKVLLYAFSLCKSRKSFLLPGLELNLLISSK
jgi:hypothetical protein